MITISFSNNAFDSNDNRLSVENCGVVSKYGVGGRDEAACLSKSASFTLSAAAGLFPAGTMALSMSFFIDKTMCDDRALLHGEGLPLNLNLRSEPEGCRLEAILALPQVTLRFSSLDTAPREAWHELLLVVRDGECVLLLDGRPQGRRVFPAELGANHSWKLHVGKRFDTSVKGGFCGCLADVSLADSLSSEQEALLLQLDDNAEGEVASKEALLAAQGVETGPRLRDDRVPFDPSSPCFYVPYRQGAVVWSPSYGCVWLGSALFQCYLQSVGQRAVGLPMADEILSTEYPAAYCICEAAALFLRGGTVYYMPGDFFTAYADRGLLASSCGLPDGPLQTLTLKTGEQLCFQRFTAAVMFKGCRPNEHKPVVVLPAWVADEYLKSPDAYGVPQGYQQGYRGNLRDDFAVNEHISADYLIASRATLCCNTYSRRRRDDRRECFVPDPDIFEFFKSNNGLHSGGPDPFGPYKCLVSPLKTTGQGTRYHDCAEGVLVRYPADPAKKVCGYTEIKITLKQISAAKINDGPGNDSAELYIEVTPFRNEVELLPEKRWPDYSARKHGGSLFTIRYEGRAVTDDHKEGENVFYSFPRLRGADKLRLRVLPFDYDKVTKNDPLGRIDIRLDIDTGWGLRDDFLTADDRLSRTTSHSGTVVNYDGMYLTQSYGDNRGGRKNIQLNFSISSGQAPYTLDDYFRKYGYWSVDNYKSDPGLSKDEFNRAFGANTNHWYDWILHFWDEVWYQAARADYSGAEGNCFGLSAEAILSLHGAGNYRLPLNDWILYSPDKRKELEDNGVSFGPDGFSFLTSYPNKAQHDAELQAIADPIKRQERSNEIWAMRRNMRYVSTSNELEQGFFQNVRQKHLYQLGWNHVCMAVNRAIDGSLLSPTTSFKNIIQLLEKEKYCLVNCFSPGGHTVLAYGWERLHGQDRILVADSNHPWWEDTGQRNGSYLVLTGGLLPEVELHYFLGSDKVAKTYKFCYPTPYHLLLNHPRVPSWIELTSFVITSILRIPEFCVRNFSEFLYVVSCGDAEVGLTGAEGSAFQLPVFSADLPAVGGRSLRLMVAPSDNAVLNVAGHDGGNYELFVGGRGRTFRLRGRLAAQPDAFEARRLGRKNGQLRHRPAQEGGSRTRQLRNAAPEITELSVGTAPYGRRARAAVRFDRAKQPPSTEKRYYLNLRRQRNGKLEVHSEDCPYLDKIKNKIYLGIHPSPLAALQIAKDYAPNADCCHCCCPQFSTD